MGGAPGADQGGRAMSESVKIRIAGTKEQVEDLTAKLKELSKQWGSRKIFRVKRYDRGEHSQLSKYHRTFGARRYVNYITMKVPEDPQQLSPAKRALLKAMMEMKFDEF